MSGYKALVFRMMIVTVIGVLSLTAARAPVDELIVSCSSEVLVQLQSRFGAAIIDAIPTADAYLIAVPSKVGLAQLRSVNDGLRISSNFGLEMADVFQQPGVTSSLRWQWVPFHTSRAPRFYLGQKAASTIEVLKAHRFSTGLRSVVALIDTGIDDTHPVLENSVVAGRNYISSGPASEWNDPVVDQSHSTVFDLLQSHSTVFDLTQGPSAFEVLRGNVGVLFISNAYGSFGSGSLPAAFGHGTMTAGLVHLMAPNAQLMPMKAFDADGRARLWNVIRAVRDAVDMGAHVINMSFSAPNDRATAELFERLAVRYAKKADVALVAAAGNSGLEVEVIPASIDPVDAIAAVNESDVKAAFSNYGRHISLTAPGSGIITTYPGAFATVSGTSFSSAFVSGLYGLLKEDGIDGSRARHAIERGADSVQEVNEPSLKHKLGKGRINAFQTLSRCGKHFEARACN